MPKLNVDYSKIVIYKIVCNDENVDYLYLGSTTDFTKRKYNHKSGCNNETNKNYNEKKYVEMRNNGGWENFRIIQVEKYPCNDKREAEAREEELRLELKANMNSNKCYTTAEQKKEYHKEYRDLNKNRIKEYRDLNKNKLNANKKEYYQNNKDKAKEYYETHKDKKQIGCPCGGKYTYGHTLRHLKTKII